MDPAAAPSATPASSPSAPSAPPAPSAKEAADEGVDAFVKALQTPFEEEPEPKAPEKKEAAPPAKTAEAPKKKREIEYEERDGKRVARVSVHGRETEVDVDEAVRAFRGDAAVKKRLEDVARFEKESAAKLALARDFDRAADSASNGDFGPMRALMRRMNVEPEKFADKIAAERLAFAAMTDQERAEHRLREERARFEEERRAYQTQRQAEETRKAVRREERRIVAEMKEAMTRAGLEEEHAPLVIASLQAAARAGRLDEFAIAEHVATVKAGLEEKEAGRKAKISSMETAALVEYLGEDAARRIAAEIGARVQKTQPAVAPARAEDGKFRSANEPTSLTPEQARAEIRERVSRMR